MAAGEELLLTLLPLGDVLQLYAVGKGPAQLIWDQFCTGAPAELSLAAFARQLEAGCQLELVLSPLRPETQVYLERHIPRKTAQLTLEQVLAAERVEVG